MQIYLEVFAQSCYKQTNNDENISSLAEVIIYSTSKLDRLCSFMQAFLKTCRVVAAHGRLKGIRQVAPPSNMWFLELTRAHNPNRISMVQPFLHSSPQSIPVFCNGPPFLPSKLPLPMGDVGSWLPSNRGFCGPIRFWRLVFMIHYLNWKARLREWVVFVREMQHRYTQHLSLLYLSSIRH